MSVLIYNNNKNATILIEGNLEIEANINSFERDINLVISEHVQNMILNFENVDSISSAGIGKILFLYKSVQVIKVTLSFINIKGELKDILDSLIFFKLVDYLVEDDSKIKP